MLTPEEKTELNYNNLSLSLKEKIDAVFKSPYLNSALALYSLKLALETEMIDSPFTIRGNDGTLEVSEKGISEAIKEAITSRQNVETAIKVAQWLTKATGDLAALQLKLLPEEIIEFEEKSIQIKKTVSELMSEK